MSFSNFINYFQNWTIVYRKCICLAILLFFYLHIIYSNVHILTLSCACVYPSFVLSYIGLLAMTTCKAFADQLVQHQRLFITRQYRHPRLYIQHIKYNNYPLLIPNQNQNNYNVNSRTLRAITLCWPSGAEKFLDKYLLLSHSYVCELSLGCQIVDCPRVLSTFLHTSLSPVVVGGRGQRGPPPNRIKSR